MERRAWVAAADQYIEECRRTRSTPRANELALRLNLSPVQLVRAFHRSVGANVGEYLKRRQIDIAKVLLTTTTMSIPSVASGAGFSNTRSFFRAFRRATGTTPSRFRHERNVSGAATSDFLN